MSAEPLYLESVKIMAQKMTFVSFDTLQVEGLEIKSLWYRYKDLDFYYFEAQDQRIIKLHVSAFGEVVEWNPYDGLRTGMIVQKEQAQGVFEVVHFDSRPSLTSIEQVQTIIAEAACLDHQQRLRLQAIFSTPLLPPQRSLLRYFWQMLRSLINK